MDATYPSEQENALMQIGAAVQAEEKLTEQIKGRQQGVKKPQSKPKGILERFDVSSPAPQPIPPKASRLPSNDFVKAHYQGILAVLFFVAALFLLSQVASLQSDRDSLSKSAESLQGSLNATGFQLAAAQNNLETCTSTQSTCKDQLSTCSAAKTLLETDKASLSSKVDSYLNDKLLLVENRTRCEGLLSLQALNFSYALQVQALQNQLLFAGFNSSGYNLLLEQQLNSTQANYSILGLNYARAFCPSNLGINCTVSQNLTYFYLVSNNSVSCSTSPISGGSNTSCS